MDGDYVRSVEIVTGQTGVAASDKDFDFDVSAQDGDIRQPIEGIAASGKIDLSNYQYPQYDISSQISGGGLTVGSAYARPVQDSDGNWWLTDIQIQATVGSTALPSFTLAGVTIPTRQDLSAHQPDGVSRNEYAFAQGAGDFQMSFDTAVVGFYISGSIRLSGKPTWATKENSFSGTIVAPVAVLVDTDWEEYTPTFTGFGTPSSVKMLWRRVGGSLEIQGSFALGTPTAVEGRVSFPSSEVVDSRLTQIQNIGTYYRGIVSTGKGAPILAAAGNSYITFATPNVFNSSSVNPLATVTGDQIAAASHVLTIKASIPIEGWKVSETGTVATTTDVIYKYAHNKTGDEKVVGEWFGQPLYERCFETTVNVPTSTNATLTTTTTGLTPVKLYGMAKDATDWYAMGASVGDVDSGFIRYNPTSGAIVLRNDGITTTIQKFCMLYLKP
jgi:hypothetical protein